MKTKSITLIISTVFLLISIAGFSAFAAQNDIDINKPGDISITMQHNSELVTDGNLVLHLVGEIDVQPGKMNFVLSEEFKNSKVDLSDISDTKIAESLLAYANKNKIAGTEIIVDENGGAKFSDLKPALYLISQTKAAAGYNTFVPFIVSVPMHNGSQYLYHIDASPKIQLSKMPAETSPLFTNPSDKPKEGKLPQTGQLNWPVPLLVVGGLVLLIIGWIVFFGIKRKK